MVSDGFGVAGDEETGVVDEGGHAATHTAKGFCAWTCRICGMIGLSWRIAGMRPWWNLLQLSRVHVGSLRVGARGFGMSGIGWMRPYV